ncbi:2-dehydro-3-deoxygluconokinase [Thalassobacillus cyri]|uniref:2-dehydro-3-deoxygluconokinase n=1 Tax=Thalassobacillus cyri TaxID=571932 RepID=A0A1H4DUU7_9BACI|nr:sugar kinase [Thalassobacillus cyri]SEA76278.1 2-dehydro-3-deoxygluconokinase [Thalassobacillus cyri]
MNNLDVVTLGETMVLFSTRENLPLDYVHQFQKQIGGAESNVAIGLARLGHRVGWISKLGSDPFGQYVNKFIRGEGVDTSEVLFTEKAPTAVFFKESLSEGNVNVYYYRKGSAASMLSPHDLNEAYIRQAKFLHITGITPALSETCNQAIYEAIEIAKRNHLTIVFDPNIRYKLFPDEDEARKTLLAIASEADVLLPGLDEGEFLTGESTPEKISSRLRQHKEQKVIIKLGEDGAYYQTADGAGYVDGFPVDQVVDPVGAGDAFASGVISGLIEEKPIEAAVRQGNAMGAFVVQMNGDIEGTPTKKQLADLLDPKQNKRDVHR